MIDKVDYSLLEKLYNQKKSELNSDDNLAIKNYGMTLPEFLATFKNLADTIENKSALIEMITYLDRVIRLQKKADASLKALELTMMDNFHHENLKRDLLKKDIRTLEVKVENLIKENFAETKRLANHNTWVKGFEEDLENAA